MFVLCLFFAKIKSEHRHLSPRKPFPQSFRSKYTVLIFDDLSRFDNKKNGKQ